MGGLCWFLVASVGLCTCGFNVLRILLSCILCGMVFFSLCLWVDWRFGFGVGGLWWASCWLWCGLAVFCVLGLRALCFLVGWCNIAFLGLVLVVMLVVSVCFWGLRLLGCVQFCGWLCVISCWFCWAVLLAFVGLLVICWYFDFLWLGHSISPVYSWFWWL